MDSAMKKTDPVGLLPREQPQLYSHQITDADDGFSEDGVTLRSTRSTPTLKGDRVIPKGLAIARVSQSDWFSAGRERPMRIAQLAPLAESVPPQLYGGTERVVSWLTEELVRRGHQVTLFATGDSLTSGTLVPVWPKALRLGRPQADPMVALGLALEILARHAAEFDLLHCHGDWVHLPLMSRLGVPFMTTLHGRLDLPGLPKLVENFLTRPSFQYQTISASHCRRRIGQAQCITASRPTCCGRRSRPESTWPSLAV
jgi:Glycosyltransferase Family 4